MDGPVGWALDNAEFVTGKEFLLATLVFVLVGLWRKWYVPGWLYRDAAEAADNAAVAEERIAVLERDSHRHDAPPPPDPVTAWPIHRSGEPE